MKLGGSAAPFKNVMMMKQSGLAQRRSGTRGSVLARAAAFLVLVGMAVSCSGGAKAVAESHPVRTRKVAVARQAGSAKAHGRATVSHASASHPTAHRSSRMTAVKDHAPARHNARSSARSHRRGQAVQTQESSLPALHRVSVKRRHEATRGSINAHEITAQSLRPSDDSLHTTTASSASTTTIYDSGESHPDQDVSVAGSQPVMAMASSAPSQVPAPLRRTAPSDLVGAPLVAAISSTLSARPRDEGSVAGLRAPSQQELTEEVEQPMVLLGRYRNGRLMVPPPLKGSHEILVHQNVMADDEGLQRVQDDADLRRMRANRQLVDLPESASLHVNPELGSDRRCARPWTVHFASDLARAYYARFHQPLQVNSAVRTVDYQVRLRRVNGNAAGIDGESASPHLTGEALDFGKHGMNVEEIAWMRMYLLPLMQSGKLDVEEEFQQACFHISVYRNYQTLSPARYRSEVAQLHRPRIVRSAQRSIQDQ